MNDAWPIELPINDPVIQFALLVAAALVIQLSMKRLQLPGLLGLLALGMLLGPGGWAVLPSEPVVDMLGQIGLIYVMFIAALEIDLDVVREHRREAALFGTLAFLCSAVLGFGAGVLLGFGLPSALLLGALISSHTLIAYPALLKMQLHRQVPVVAAVGGTLITDTLALVALAIVLSVSAPNASLLGALLPLALLAVFAIAALAAIPRVSRHVLATADITAAEQALLVLAILLVLATAAALIGTEEILGAFLAGIALNRVLARRTDLREHIEFVGRMLFIPFFFIWTGTLLELDALFGEARVWVIGGVLVGLVLVGKSTAAWVTGALSGYTVRERVLMAGLTVPQAAATLAITITAYQEGLFDTEVVDAVVILILITCVIGPVVTQRIGRRMRRRIEAGADPRHRAVDEEAHA